MAKGEARYQSAGRPVVRFEYSPIARGMYQLPLEEKGLEVKKSEAKGPDAIPYINCSFRASGTADKNKENSKDRLVFHKFFLSMKPGSDGVIMPERGGGIVEYCRANGEEADFPILTLKKEDNTTEDYMDPDAVLEYLVGKVGTPLNGRVEIEAAKDQSGQAIKGHLGNNKIAFWELSEEMMTGKAAAPSAPATKSNGKALPPKRK